MADDRFPGWHGTTILAVRRGGRVVVAGDGQVSVGQTVMKGTARMTSIATKPLKPSPVFTWPSQEAWISCASVDCPALKSCPNATRPMMSSLHDARARRFSGCGLSDAGCSIHTCRWRCIL